MKYKPEDNHIEGWMNAQELEWLYDKASEMDSIVEVGSWKGRSSHALLSGCKGKVYCVDHFMGSPHEREGAHKEAVEKDISNDFLENVGHFPNMVMMKMESVQAANKFDDKSIDMIFIDGGHDFNSIDNDLTAWLPKAKKLICGHDREQDGVPEALKNHFPNGYEKYEPLFWGVRI